MPKLIAKLDFTKVVVTIATAAILWFGRVVVTAHDATISQGVLQTVMAQDIKDLKRHECHCQQGIAVMKRLKELNDE